MHEHRNAHWGILVAVSIFVGVFLVGQINITYNPNKAEASASLLQTSDITCAGMFLTPHVNGGSYTSAYPVTMRYENGNRHYFMYGGDGHIVEFPEPTLSPCNTPLTQANRAHAESWGGDWGKFDVNAGSGVVPGAGAAYAMGLSYDNPTNQLMVNWTNTYSVSPPHNSFAAATLDSSTHRLTTTGCWGLSTVNQPQVAGGVLNIPSSFISSYLPSGTRWAVGFGGATASYVGLSLGPTLFAIAPPAGNPCTSGVDNFINNAITLVQYGQNSTGPHCSLTNVSGPTIGCTPTQAPTAPYPAKLAFTNYSMDMYYPDWNPWQGHGWMGFGTGFSMGWYDDGVKQGVIVPIQNTEGWANTTVRATPAPTFDTPSLNPYGFPTGTMYVTSTDTHDGNNMNPGDTIWIQTCAPGIDPNCAEGGNDRHLSFAVIDSVTPSTGRVAFHITGPDFSTGNHLPVVGGAVYLGCLYAHGGPTCSRATYLLQIYDPAQYGQVISHAINSYDVTYSQEMDLTSMVTGFGSPALGHGVTFGGEHHGPVSTMTDPAAHQFMVAFTDAGSLIGIVSDAVYVFNAGSNAVTPPIAPQPSPSPITSPSPTPSTPTPTPTPVTPGVPSAECTKATGVVDALGHTWTIGFSWTLRDGVYALPGGGSLGGAQGSMFKIISGVANVLDPRDATWYRWNESSKSFTKLTTTEPTCTTSSPTPIPAPAPAPAPTPSPITVPLAGDLNNDNIVNSLDWSIMSNVWFTSNSAADLNHDGIVNSIDFSILNRNWFRTGS